MRAGGTGMYAMTSYSKGCVCVTIAPRCSICPNAGDGGIFKPDSTNVFGGVTQKNTTVTRGNVVCKSYALGSKHRRSTIGFIFGVNIY